MQNIFVFNFNYQFLIVFGGLAQLVERLLCKQDVSGSSPLTSTFGKKQQLKLLMIVFDCWVEFQPEP